jgi:hypothetical protein
MSRNHKFFESDLKTNFIIELSRAELKVIMQLVHLYKAEFSSSVLADVILNNLRTQTDISSEPIVNDVFDNLLNSNNLRKGMTKMVSVPFIPYEEAARGEAQCRD